ncbi:DNA-binding protein (plasmid) [Cupriavidus basilensis]
MNTIHRHWTVWQSHQKPAPRKLSEPNSRLLTALGAELSKVAEEAATESEAALAQALQELAAYAANGEALEAERDRLAEQMQQITTERDTLAGKAAEQAAEIARSNEELERERHAVASVRRLLAQAELRLEAVPRLEAELAALRASLLAEQTARNAADKAAAVAEARRVAAEAAQQQAEARLASGEQREAQVRKDVADAMAAHLATREKLVETVAAAATAEAELKALRDQVGTQQTVEKPAEEGTSPDAAKSRTRKQ